MTTVTKSDVFGVCGYGQEDAVLEAYQSGDILELGNMCKRRIEKAIADRIAYHEEQKAKYRAEILAEACAGGEA